MFFLDNLRKQVVPSFSLYFLFFTLFFPPVNERIQIDFPDCVSFVESM